MRTALFFALALAALTLLAAVSPLSAPAPQGEWSAEFSVTYADTSAVAFNPAAQVSVQGELCDGTLTAAFVTDAQGRVTVRWSGEPRLCAALVDGLRLEGRFDSGGKYRLEAEAD